jgi:hypothetical protein
MPSNIVFEGIFVFVGAAGNISNFLIEDLIEINTFHTNLGKFIRR